MNQGIELPLFSHQSLSFDYLSLCRSINVEVVQDILFFGSSPAYNRFLIQQEVFSLFMKKFPEIRYLKMRSIEHHIFYLPKAKTCLDSLCELECDTSIEPVYFYGLAYICKHVQRFVVINSNVKGNDGVIKLIEVQTNLRYFEWRDNLLDEEFNYEHVKDFHEGTFLALEKKADTLNHLIMSFYWVRYIET